MGVNSLPKTVTGQRRGCDLNPGHTATESSTLTTRIPSHPSDCTRNNLDTINLPDAVTLGEGYDEAGASSVRVQDRVICYIRR